MINAKAISIISECYQGHERIQPLWGYRGSAEVVGTALTLAVGQLLRFGWTATLLVYTFLLFGSGPFSPCSMKGEVHQRAGQKEKMTAGQSASPYYQLCGWGNCISNTAINLRVPSLVLYSSNWDSTTGQLDFEWWHLSGARKTNQDSLCLVVHG